MIDLELISEYLLSLQEKEQWEPEPLYLEDYIRPEDLPPNTEPFPQRLPNKKVIILDI